MFGVDTAKILEKTNKGKFGCGCGRVCKVVVLYRTHGPGPPVELALKSLDPGLVSSGTSCRTDEDAYVFS